MKYIWTLLSGENARACLKKTDNDEYIFSVEDMEVVTESSTSSFGRSELEGLYHKIKNELDIAEAEIINLPLQREESRAFKVILQITDRHGIVESEESLYASSCGSPIIPAEGNTILRKGKKYHIHSVIWDYDKNIVYVLCRINISRTVRSMDIRGNQ